MKKILKKTRLFLIAACVLFCTNASAIMLVRTADPFVPYAEREQVAFVGDSLTQGNQSVIRGGYRFDLMSFITELHDGVPVNVVGENYPTTYSYALIGASGITSTQLKTTYVEPQLAAIPSVTMKYPPDTVFLLIGTNDFLSAGSKATWLSNVTSIIASFRAANPECKVFVGNLIDRDTYTATVVDWNASLATTLESLPNYDEYIFSVNLYGAVGPYSGATYADQTHTNQAGYLLMAQGWFDIYETVF